MKNTSTSEVKIRNTMVDMFIHGQNVALISSKIAAVLNFNTADIQLLAAAAALHDIGKKDIPIGILSKPEKLTLDEMVEMRKHTLHGFNAVINDNRFRGLANIILYHHEDNQGSGYYNLKGNEIPLASKIIQVADVYDALVSDRPYRKAYSHEDALTIMEKESCKYDPKVYEAFKREYFL